jgi:hypothetical protein
VRELLRTGDIVRLSFIQSLLADAGIENVVLDRNTGSVFLGAVVPRVMVADDDLAQARRVLADAGERLDD